jgi:hypothetical protein
LLEIGPDLLSVYVSLSLGGVCLAVCVCSPVLHELWGSFGSHQAAAV